MDPTDQKEKILSNSEIASILGYSALPKTLTNLRGNIATKGTLEHFINEHGLSEYINVDRELKPGIDVFTTGDVAKILGTAQATVAKLIREGFLKSYRGPGFRDRRILRRHLEEFLQSNNLSGFAVIDQELRPGRDVLTTGDIATALLVSHGKARTLVDDEEKKGNIKVYRLPGHEDRRILRKDFEQFLRIHNVPLDMLNLHDRQERPPTNSTDAKIMFIGVDEPLAYTITQRFPCAESMFLTTETPFHAGIEIRKSHPNVIIIGPSIDINAVSHIVKGLRNGIAGRAFESTPVIGIALEDGSNRENLKALCNAVIDSSEPQLIADEINRFIKEKALHIPTSTMAR